MSAGYSISDILDAYPHLKSEQVFAALEYAAEVIVNEQVIFEFESYIKKAAGNP